MFSGLLDGGLLVPVRNRHKDDRLTIGNKNPNVCPLIVQGAPSQVQPLLQFPIANTAFNIMSLSATGALFLSNAASAINAWGTTITSSQILSIQVVGASTQGWILGSSNSSIFSGDTSSGTNSFIFAVASGTYTPSGNTAKIGVDCTNGRIQGGGRFLSTGTDIAGQPLFISGGQSTGAGAGGNLLLQAGTTGTTGTTLNALTTVATISTATQNVLIQATAATVIPAVLQHAATPSADYLRYRKSDSSTVLAGMDFLARPYTLNTTPTIAAGAGAGGSPTVSISGTDVNGVVTVTSGTLPTGAAVVVTVTFSAAYGTTPKTVLLTAANAAAAALNALTMVWVDSAGLGTGSWTINAGATGLGAATAYKWYYQVLG